MEQREIRKVGLALLTDIGSKWIKQQRMEELSLSWNRGKNEQICTVKFQNFLEAMPPIPHTREGLRRPSPNPTPSALRFE